MLISIIVITYNSSKYVLETLESIYLQTYVEIELIVSDDCSIDNSLTICQDWVSQHKHRFVNSIVVSTHNNKGICHNYNNALKYATGEYIKYIAGDDILKEQCIERLVANIKPNTFLYFSGADRIMENGKKQCEYYENIPNVGYSSQFKIMLRYHPMVFGPCIFVHRAKLVELHGFDEQYPMSEDYPIMMKFLSNGYSVFFVNESLVKWRMHEDSVSCSNVNNFKVSVKKAVLFYSKKYCLRNGLFFTPYHDWLDFWIPEHYTRGRVYKVIGYALRLLDPIYIKRKLFGGYAPLIEKR